MTRRTAIVDGALAGVAGAGCMTVLRLAARRWGLIDVTPPQATKAWLTGTSPHRDDNAAHHVLAAGVHAAVSAAGGAVYGARVEPGVRPALAGGAFFGLAVWAAAFGVIAPALGITRAPWRGTWKETAVNATAHLVYGVSLAIVTGELGHQATRPGAGVRAVRARVG